MSDVNPQVLIYRTSSYVFGCVDIGGEERGCSFCSLSINIRVLLVCTTTEKSIQWRKLCSTNYFVEGNNKTALLGLATTKHRKCPRLDGSFYYAAHQHASHRNIQWCSSTTH